MTIEVPVLRLGMAGHNEAQAKKASAAAAVHCVLAGRWARFADADAWWLEGSRTVLLPNEYLQPAVATERSVQLALADVDRPVAFPFRSRHRASSRASSSSFPTRTPRPGCAQFADWMKVKLSQFALASSITNNQPSLGSGSWKCCAAATCSPSWTSSGAGVMPGVTLPGPPRPAGASATSAP